MKIAEIVTVGSELLTGMIVNTNAAFIGEKLMEAGLDVKWVTSVGDNEEDILHALEIAESRASVIVITGGLGPTHDDITKKTVAHYFRSKLVFDPVLYDSIKARFKMMGRRMPPSNRSQAFIPDNAERLPNLVGSALGLLFIQGDNLFFILPGVPSEMKLMMMDSVIPRIKQLKDRSVIRVQVIRTADIFESKISQKLEGFQKLFPQVKLAYLPRLPGVDLRLVATGQKKKDCVNAIKRAEEYIHQRVGKYIYGSNDESLEQSVAELLIRKKQTLSIAESCTGGLISHKITQVPGSSKFFHTGVVAYSNEVKIDILHVPKKYIIDYGAVSPQVAEKMAEGVRRAGNSSIGISTTGISGPTGGTSEKPVGLVFIGYADENGTMNKKYIFTKDRWWHKERSAIAALNIVRNTLLQRT